MDATERDLRDVLARALHDGGDGKHRHDWLSPICLADNYGQTCADGAYEEAVEALPVVLAWHREQIAEAEKRGAVKALRGFGLRCNAETWQLLNHVADRIESGEEALP